jgi:hypothetical protein
VSSVIGRSLTFLLFLALLIGVLTSAGVLSLRPTAWERALVRGGEADLAQAARAVGITIYIPPRGFTSHD